MARRLKRAVIKEEFVELTGNHIAALILNQMLYWTERVEDFDRFLLETQLRQRNIDIELQGGWIYKNTKELSEELMVGLSHQSIRRYLQALIDAGFLQERNNPLNGWDRTMQYRVDIVAIVKALDKLGYALEGYTKLQPAIVHDGQSIVQNGHSSLSKMDNRTSKMDAVPYITETTTETTNKESERAVPVVEPPPPTPPTATPTASTPATKTPRLPNSDYEMPTVVVTPKRGRPAAKTLSPHVKDAAFTKDGTVERETGKNPVAIYYEFYSIYDHKLAGPVEDDLPKTIADLALWREIVTEWQQCDNKPTYIKGMLDWYHYPERRPSRKFAKSTAGPSTNGNAPHPTDLSYKQWLLQTYGTTIAAMIKPESELQHEYKQWRHDQGLPPGI